MGVRLEGRGEGGRRSLNFTTPHPPPTSFIHSTKFLSVTYLTRRLVIEESQLRRAQVLIEASQDALHKGCMPK